MMSRGRIRAPKKSGRVVSSDNFEENWSLLESAMGDIHNKNASKYTYERLYRACYLSVISKHGEQLYSRIRDFESRHFLDHLVGPISQLVTPGLAALALQQVLQEQATSQAQSQPQSQQQQQQLLLQTQAAAPSLLAPHERRAMGERLLRGIKDSWERHDKAMNMVADVMMYLDRHYVDDRGLPSVYTVSIGLFRDHVLGGGGPAATIGDVLNAVLLDQIDMDRDGDVVDRHLLRGCVAMLESLYETDDELEDERLYNTSFEPVFLDATARYYRAECARLLHDADARAWLRQARRRLRDEEARCGHTVAHGSAAKTAAVVERELVAASLEDFLALDGSGLRSMLDHDRYEDLGMLYDLIVRVPEKKGVLKRRLQRRIVELGCEVEKALRGAVGGEEGGRAAEEAGTGVFGTASGTSGTSGASGTSAASAATAAAIKWVTDILELKDKFDRIWAQCFDADHELQSAMATSFTELFRLCARSAEYVSLYIDDTFKRGLRGKSDAEIDAALDRATVMVQHVTEKDMLERYYQKHLARRLLHNKSENPEAEKLMISRMQAELGKTFTSKFEGMFKDMATSAELTRSYAKYAQEVGEAGEEGGSRRIDLAVSVLTTNNWPPEVMGRTQWGGGRDKGEGEEGEAAEGGGGRGSNQGEPGCLYPPEIQRLQRSFLTFYLRNRSGRVLSWVGSAGSADIRCVFPAVGGKEGSSGTSGGGGGQLSRERRYELTVPTHGMVVLLLFNDVPVGAQLAFAEIQARTNIPPAELTRVLASLSLPPRCRVLRKEPMSKTVRPTDRFSFNDAFVSKSLKIKVPVVHAQSRVEGDEERRATEEKNNQTRSHTIDAAVVRIMKQRKELSHTSLVNEVVAQLVSLFHPEVAMIKKRIEDLMAREYLERIEESSPPAYRYVA